MTMTKTVRLLLIGAALASAVTTLAPGTASARDRAAPGSNPSVPLERIAAVVNDDAISFTDTEARFRLALVSSNLPDTPEVRQRLMPQVLRSLIEERLQLQEAKRLNISAPDQEVKDALAKIAEQNRMQRAEFDNFLNAHNVPISTLMAQVRSGLAWNKLVQRKLRPQVFVSDEEIDAVLERVRANAGKPEYLTAEIFLAVDTPSQDDDVRRTGEHLVDLMRQGAPFSAVARQFSQAAGANTGGDLGWIQAGQLADDLNKALMQLQPGLVSPPIRSASGYHILMVRDMRTISAGDPNETQVHLMQMTFPLGSPAERAAQISRARDIASKIKGCDAFDSEIKANRNGADMGSLKVGELPPDLARLVSALPIGQPSQPLGNERQAIVVMVCERKTTDTSLPNRDAVHANLGNERIDQLQRRYLYDLRRAAYVDIRM